MNHSISALTKFIFWSRWLQAPLYVGLIVTQGVYVYLFMHELIHLVTDIGKLDEYKIMLIVLGLIDVVMISNLLIMVTIGGFETFVTKLHISQDSRPEWLGHVNAQTMKIKLAMALVGISSVHLLKTFIDIKNFTEHEVKWQVIIHIVFLISAVVMAYTAILSNKAAGHMEGGGH